MTKVDIISGFLGAGKTTFIRKMIKEAWQGQQIVLIENEFGEVGIDGGFLKDSGIEITEMNSGCICCTLVGDFAKSMREVLDRFHPDRILIEPSGVGKLSDVMTSVIDLEKEEPEVKLNALVTVVNALKAEKQMKAFGEFFNNQIEHANTILLSRSQKATPEQLEKCVKAIKELNPKATVITTPWDDIDGKKIDDAIEGSNNLNGEMEALAIQHHEADEAEEAKEEEEWHRLHPEDHDDDDEDEHEHHHHDHDEDHDHDHDEDHDHHDHEHHHHHHHHHHHDADEVFNNWGIETPHVFERSVIENAMKAFAETDDYGDVVRSKGMVPSTDGTWIYFDFVDGEYELRTGEPDVTGRLVVIGSGVDSDKVSKLFGLS